MEREEKGRNGKDGEVRGEEVGIAEELILGQCLLSPQVILSDVLFQRFIRPCSALSNYYFLAEI